MKLIKVIISHLLWVVFAVWVHLFWTWKCFIVVRQLKKIEFLKFLGIQPYLIGHNNAGNFSGNIILWFIGYEECLSAAYIRWSAKHEWNCILHNQLSPKAENVWRFVDEHCTLVKRPTWKVGIKANSHHGKSSSKYRNLKFLKKSIRRCSESFFWWY